MSETSQISYQVAELDPYVRTVKRRLLIRCGMYRSW